ncbi:hypothetical protein ABK040_004522 [Willaertia magna]
MNDLTTTLQQEQQQSTIHSSLGELVNEFEKAAISIFNQHNIDFCCGGKRSLLTACSNNLQEANEILQQITNLSQQQLQQEKLQENKEQKKFTEMTNEELINYIVNTHHSYLRENLPIISNLILKVYNAHLPKLLKKIEEEEELLFYKNCNKNSCNDHVKENNVTNKECIEMVEQLYKLFQQLSTELLLHLIKEEKDVFPTILLLEQKHYNNDTVNVTTNNNTVSNNEINNKEEWIEQKEQKNNKKILILEGEHVEAGKLLQEIAEIRKKLPDWCQTVKLMKEKLVELERDLYQHVHLENNLLFKRLLN